MQEIEIEFKNLLTKQEYLRLIDQVVKSTPTPKTQVNHYFETDDFQLRQNQMALRIRQKHQAYVATLKQPHEDGLLETHDDLTEQQVKQWLRDQISLPPNISKQLARIDLDEKRLKYQGALTTHRIEEDQEQFTLVLDHSEYNQTEDFELELEVNSYEYGQEIFNHLLKQYQIPKRHTKNKIVRFFESFSS
ncbi:CYTH domain-containing protein [Alkalibacillus aidingensis]|uniref:CYTH domain-containing protein n=1 Tax=Alkalibacillus aidingensis TaxID=2747607 RepID=UPI001661094D|nr:CYTH domain-containing protein [Alkalibacillus aidingensis]